MKTAAAYIRVSTEEQTEFSPDSQLAALKRYADSNNIYLPVSLIFIDEGITGRNTKKRTAFNKMIAMAKTKPRPFDMILVWKFSRFARSREDSVVYKSMLRKEFGIDVVSVSEPVGDDKMSVLFEAIIEAMDEYYSINLAEEVRRGMCEKAKRGGVLSGPPFGYAVKDGEYTIVPGEAVIIRKVFSDYANGSGFLKIAKELNDLGVVTHRGSKIESRTVEYWLHNPVYAGVVRWNPMGALSRNYTSDTAILAKGTHSPIIESDIWSIVQSRLKQRKAIYDRHISDGKTQLSHWLVGIARCGICKAVLSNQGGYFGCSKRCRGLCCGVGYIKAPVLERIVMSVLSGFFPEQAEYIFEEKKNKAGCDKPENYNILRTGIKSRIKRVRKGYESGVYTLEEFIQAKKEAEEELRRIDALSEKSHIDNKQSKVIKQKTIGISEVLQGDTDNTDKNRLARIIFKEITVTKQDNIKYINLVFRR